MLAQHCTMSEAKTTKAEIIRQVRRAQKSPPSEADINGLRAALDEVLTRDDVLLSAALHQRYGVTTSNDGESAVSSVLNNARRQRVCAAIIGVWSYCREKYDKIANIVNNEQQHSLPLYGIIGAEVAHAYTKVSDWLSTQTRPGHYQVKHHQKTLQVKKMFFSSQVLI